MDEEGNPIVEEEAPADEEGDKKKVVFNPKAFAGPGQPGWTISDKQSKNLMTLFTTMKGQKAQADLRDAENYSKQHY